MNATFSLLLLVLVGLFGVGCSGEDDAFSQNRSSDDDYQDRSSQQSAQPAGFSSEATPSEVAAPRLDRIHLRRYTEPREQAFSFEAPDGWRVEAQLLRRSPTKYRGWTTITSPDGKIRIASGQPEHHAFVEPSQMTPSMDLREGATMGDVIVARYQSALAFGEQNLRAIADGCSGLQITGRTERPDEAQRQQAKARREAQTPKEADWANRMHVNAAEIAFTCQGPDGPLEGRAVAATTRLKHTGSTGWSGGLRGYLAPPGRSEDAYRIMEHAAQTQQQNPQWWARQRQAYLAQQQANQQFHQSQMQASQQAHQQRMAQNQASFNAHQQRMADQRAAFDAQHQAWRNNQATQDRMHDQSIGSIRDETRVWDTHTGRAYDVPTGSDGYYIDNTGSAIIGTPGYAGNPDPTTYDPMVEGYDYDDESNN